MRHLRRRRPRWKRALIVVTATTLVASACSSDTGGDGATGGGVPGDRAAGSECTFDDPSHGGRLVYGLEADTLSPWTPQGTAMAISGHMVAKSVYDTLTLLAADGTPVPNLAESWEHDDDYTEWVLRIREGVSFHDGTPLDGEAVAENLRRFTEATVTSRVTRDVEAIEADGMTVTIRMRRPYAHMAVILSSQIGYVASPTWLAAVDDDPTLAAQPVGTGPFRFVSYTPGNGNSYVGTCNPDYWREGRPRLDEVEFRVLEDTQSRSNALISGEIDVMHTANGDEIAEFRERNDEFQLVEVDHPRETTYVLLNNHPEVAVGFGRDPQPNPLADVAVRRALAQATDSATLVEARDGGVADVANGPFPPGSTGYLDDTGYPTHDPDAAEEAVAEWEAANGELVLNFATTSDPFNRLTAELVKEMWETAGVEIRLSTVEQTQYIAQAATGTFQAFTWRSHGGLDPILQDVWWNSELATDPPGIALNFGRIRDDVIDAQLATIRESDDADARREAAETVNRRFGEQVYNLWQAWPVWGVVADPAVAGLTGDAAPGGTDVHDHAQGAVGSHSLATTHWES